MAEHRLIGTVFQSFWDWAMYYFLYPVLGEGVGGQCVSGTVQLLVSVSQAQYGSPRLDQTQGLHLESLSLKNCVEVIIIIKVIFDLILEIMAEHPLIGTVFQSFWDWATYYW